MQLYRLRNRAEYDEHLSKQHSVLKQRFDSMIELEHANRNNKRFTYDGFSITAGKHVSFEVDWAFSNGQNVNWRERLICPETKLNNRLRASYHLYLSELRPYPSDAVYITEQVTAFYQFLAQKVNGLVGSEYLEADEPTKIADVSGIRHEDLTQLSFNDDTFDSVISFDCLEHIPDYRASLAECHRVMKPGARALMSFPFAKNFDTTLVRAKVLEDGSISHIVEPEYHGTPLSDQGCLSYYTFGWDILDTCRDLGFSDAYAVLYWSSEFGYLGLDEQIAFVLQK